MRPRIGIEVLVAIVTSRAGLQVVSLRFNFINEDLLYCFASNSERKLGVLLAAVGAESVTQVVARRSDRATLAAGGLRIIAESLGRMVERPALTGSLRAIESLPVVET